MFRLKDSASLTRRVQKTTCAREAASQDGERKHAPVDHLFEFLIVHPHGLRDGLDAPDVGVGSFQDVFQLGELRGDAGGTGERAKGDLVVSVTNARLGIRLGGTRQHKEIKRRRDGEVDDSP